MKKLILSLLFVSLPVLACDGGIPHGNSRHISALSLDANDMTEQEFRSTLKDFEKFFGPSVDNEHKAELQVIGSWGSNTVNAYAERDDDAWLITIYGGLARHPAITLDGLKATLCHELGHHLGGYPKKSTNKWSSAEGQADYFAMMKCLRHLWEKEDNIGIMSKKEVPAFVKKECATSYSSVAEQALCQRMSLAGKSLANMFQDLDHDSIEPKFDTPDTLVVRAMNYMHPFAQCRLDTYFNGAICPASAKIEFDNDDEVVGACHGTRGDTRGLRPRCWFVPKK